MTLFLLTFISIYTCMHALVFARIRILLSGKACLQILTVFFFALMVVAPIGARLLEREGHELVARVTAYIAYFWMGFVSLSFCGFLLLWSLDILGRGLRYFKLVSFPQLLGVVPTAAVLVFITLVCLYGAYEATQIRVERVVIPTLKLPENKAKLKIAQISDIHLGLMVRDGRLKRIMDRLRSENPDLLVSTGDLVDGSMGQRNGIPELFMEFDPPLGKFAITGNHEFYAGLKQSLELTELFGFKVLRGEAVNVGGVLNIVGVDDPTSGESQTRESLLLAEIRNGAFTLFLKHRPEAREESLGLFDLQLSGHTHRGQIFPFNLVIGLVYPMQDGLYRLSKGSWLYTSRGTGTWGPPMRVLSPPEVTIIELVRQGAAF